MADDREPFREARAAGLKARNERRLARAQERDATLRGIPIEPYSLVNQLADLWEVPVDVRQATNDRSWEFAADLFDEYAKSIAAIASEAALRLGRKEAGEDLRYLAEARKDYCHRCPETQNDMRDMGPTELGVHDGHATASWLADIIDGTNDAMGWLPSWRWDEWAERTSRATQTATSGRTDPEAK